MASTIPRPSPLLACGLLGLCVGAFIGKNLSWKNIQKITNTKILSRGLAVAAKEDREDIQKCARNGTLPPPDEMKDKDPGCSDDASGTTTSSAPPPPPSACQDNLFELMRHRLDVLVVFSAGHPVMVPQEGGKEDRTGDGAEKKELKYRAALDEYEIIGDKELYLGAPERFLAASRIAPYADIVVVLAGVQPHPHDPWDEVRAIAHVLCEEYTSVPRDRVVGVVSEATTMGGMWALKKWVKQYLEGRRGKVHPGSKAEVPTSQDSNPENNANTSPLGVRRGRPRIGLLTGFYHVPRVMRFVGDLLEDELEDVNFIPLAAEAFLPDTHPPLYAQNFEKHGKAFLGRWKAEYGGLGMFEVGGYRDQDREHGWMCEVFTAEDLLRGYV